MVYIAIFRSFKQSKAQNYTWAAIVGATVHTGRGPLYMDYHNQK